MFWHQRSIDAGSCSAGFIAVLNPPISRFVSPCPGHGHSSCKPGNDCRIHRGNSPKIFVQVRPGGESTFWPDVTSLAAAGNTNITVPLTSCLTGLESAALQLTIFFICKTDWSKLVQQEVNGTVILPPLVFPGCREDLLKGKAQYSRPPCSD